MASKWQAGAMKHNGSKTIWDHPKPDPLTAAMQRVMERVRRMSHAERVQSLKEAGILTRTGKLASAYK